MAVATMGEFRAILGSDSPPAQSTVRDMRSSQLTLLPMRKSSSSSRLLPLVYV